MSKQPISDQFAYLDTLLTRLESEELSLDYAISLYQEALTQFKTLKKSMKSAELSIQKVKDTHADLFSEGAL